MNKFRPFILAAAVVCAALLAYGMFTLPKAKDADAEGFSATRVLEDIKVISQDNHSVAHPEERAQVREYLVDRLEAMGGEVSLFQYDSLVGPKGKHVEYVFDAVNILADFPASGQNEDNTCLMFVAHYDSRYSNPMPKDTVWSYGAADDGYGVGVTLETLSQLLKHRQDWKQGVKVLFTDAEEVGMMGMKAAWEKDRQLFDDVGFIINLEARGTMGPALLFETCPGNEKVMELYQSEARYPYTYSLTTVVYGFMPNFTDFTIVKDYIPGMNFSTIADINHYHTDLDNFSNVKPNSIQHYGEQILPIALKYVTDPAYADKDALKAEKDTTNFTIPCIGLLNVGKTTYMVMNIVVFLLFLGVFALDSVRGRLKASLVFRYSCIVLCVAIGILAFGELIAYLCSAIAGAHFKPFGIVQGIPFDNVAMIVSLVLVAAVTILVYCTLRRNAVRRKSASMRVSAAYNAASKFAFNMLYGVLVLMFVLSAVLLLSLGENLMFLIPLTFTTAALILKRMTSMKVWLLLAIFCILLHAFSFYYALAMALTIGAFGAVAMLAFLDIILLIPLSDIYLTAKPVKQ